MLLLFDIDGTLLLKATREHVEAVTAAIREVWGVRDLAAVDAAGRTDRDIVRQVLMRKGVDTRRIDDGMASFVDAAADAYGRLVPDDLASHVAPGVPAALEALAARDGTLLTLVTGNLEPIARMKLHAAGLARYFARGQGAFGSDHEDRAALPAIARARAARRNGGTPWPRRKTVVIGDTPRDIACARADGVRCVAIATGPYRADELRGADKVIAHAGELPAALGV